MSHVLEAQNVAYAYEPSETVFSAVDATVRSGFVTGIVGPNGSGKSTLLRVLCGLLHPSEGRVCLDGHNLHRFRERVRARTVAFLPQSVDPAFALSSFEVVCLGRYPHTGVLGGLGRHDFDVALRCMAQTETEHLRDRDFTSLSGGERQRVLLASILAQEPELLLLDEPTSALDIHHQIEIFALLKRLARDGYGIGVVTHDLNLAARFCDLLLLLASGKRVLASGPPEQVLTEALLSEAYSSGIRVGVNPITQTPLICAREERDTNG